MGQHPLIGDCFVGKNTLPVSGRRPPGANGLAMTPGEKEVLARQIESTDGMIDRLVYALSPSGMRDWLE